MLLGGICVLVLGVSSAALGSVKIELNQNKKKEVKTPRMLFFDVISLGLGVVFLVSWFNNSWFLRKGKPA